MDVRGCKYLFAVFSIIFFATLLDVTASAEEHNEVPLNKNARFLSMFEIINFPNDACTGDSKNGTCYTSAECEDLGGTKDGDCAQGYGVCCTFDVECGATVVQNNTYFTKSSSFSTGSCAIQVCPKDDICQLRLDFTSFVLNGPYSTTDTSLLKDAASYTGHEQLYAYGVPNKDGVAVVVDEGQCVGAAFTVTGSGTNPPVICGTNTGDHLYVDVKGGSCATLAFDVNTASSLNSWNIQMTQYACDYNNLAPSGCNQYFFGSNTGLVRTFNYAGGNHLAYQDQNICFRRDSGKTKLCLSYVNDASDFSVSSGAVANKAKGYVGMTGTANGAGCCNYGAAGKGGAGGMYDCLQIPGASDGADNGVKVGTNIVEGAFCGNNGLYVTGAEATPAGKTVCTKQTPFKIRFLSDGNEESTNEVLGDHANGGKGLGIAGFQLGYILT